MLFLYCKVSKVGHSGLVCFFCKILNCVGHQTNPCVARVAVDEVGSSANHDHKRTNVKFFAFNETRLVDVLLNDNIAKFFNKLIKVLLFDALFKLSFFD